MRPLTEDEWSTRFAELRPVVAEEFPQIPDQELEDVRGDWDGLVAVLQRTLNLDADVVRQRLRNIDLDEAAATAPDSGGRTGASVENIRIAAGFSESEHARIRRTLQKLNRRLANFPADAVDGELSIKDRDTTSQKVTCEVWLPNLGHIVATSKEASLQDALMDVRADLYRQIDEAVARRKNY